MQVLLQCLWYRTGGPEITPAQKKKTEKGGQEVHSDPLKSWFAAGVLSLPCFTSPNRNQNMMERTTTLWLFLFLNQLNFYPIDADRELSTMQTHTSHSENRLGSTALAEERSLTTSDYNNSSDLVRADCLMDTELGLIALGSAGGLIVCLLVTTIVLACQVCQLQHRARLPRSSRSNLDLVSSTGYWGADRAEVQGLVGPCDASVMLEEVRADGRMEEDADIREVVQEAGGRRQEEAMAGDGDPEEKVALMQASSSRDSCVEVPRDLEDMPLVV